MDDALRTHIEDHMPEYVDDLARLCRQPSVAAQGQGIHACADLVRRMLEEAGVPAQVLATRDPRYPLVHGQRGGRSPRRLLFYDHFDVQPAEPLELWHSPPFEPVARDGRFYARGVSDDKGHFVARLAAVKALLAVRGELPCHVAFCLEGAEEIASPGFEQFVQDHRDLLRADGCLWEGGGVDWEGNPQITLGLKGILYVELAVRAAARDSHSSVGTVVPNAAWRLVWALQTLKDPQERILIPGFYDAVRPPTPPEMEAVAAMPADDEEMRRSLELESLLLDLRGREYRRRHLFEPTCTICGIESGYTGPGAKTVLPAEARAKLDFRLVPDQSADDIRRKLEAHLVAQGFGDVQVVSAQGVRPSRTPVDHPFVRLVADAARAVYGREPVIVPTLAGSGPMHSIGEGLGMPVATSGVANPDSRLHAPNENIRLDDFRTGVLHAAEIMERFGAG